MENYKLYDAATGLEYNVQVPRKDVAALDLDKERRFRLLNKLKAQSVAPAGRFAEDSNAGASDVSETSDWMPTKPIGKSKTTTVQSKGCGKLGGRWDPTSTSLLLSSLKPYRRELRVRVVKRCVWEKCCETLAALGYIYNPDQAAEKIRNLKNDFRNAKQGKRNKDGVSWAYFKEMEYLYDLPIENDESQSASVVVGTYDSYLNDFPEGDFLQSTLTQSNKEADHGDNFLQPSLTQSNIKAVHGDTSTAEGLVYNSFLMNTQDLVNFKENFDVDDQSSYDKPSAKSGSQANSFLMKTIDINTYQTNLQGDEDINCNSLFDPALGTQSLKPISEEVEPLDVVTLEAQVSSDAFVFATPTKPTRKNRKTGEGESAAASINTPEKSPRRKSATQSHLVWSVDATKEFINLCVCFKADVQKDNPPNEVWKKICLQLDNLGTVSNLTWQLCRSKFLYMNSFFAETLLAVSGILNGVKWPYYDSFLEIHDLPLDYQVVDTEVDDGLGTEGATLWKDPNRVVLLLNLYKERYPLFKGSKSMIRHSTLYAEISGTLRMFEVRATAKQCQGKVKELESKFRQEYDNARKTGAPPSTWPFYKNMLPIYGGNASLEASYSFSVGSSKDQYLKKGKEEVEVPRNSRNRPRTATNSKKETKSGPKKKLYMSMADEMKERQIAAHEEMAAEIRLLRTGIESSSARRMPLLDSLTASIAILARAKISNNENIDP